MEKKSRTWLSNQKTTTNESVPTEEMTLSKQDNVLTENSVWVNTAK